MTGIALDSALCFAFRGNRLLVRDNGLAVALPAAGEIDEAALPVRLEEPFRGPEGAVCRALDVPEDEEPPPGMAFHGLRALYGRIPEPLFALAGRAFQLLEWGRNHRFCGRCGAPTRNGTKEQAKECVSCGALHFPRLAPAVIVTVRRGDELLLARSPHFAPGVFSALAGFVEPGETLEEAVVREVHEEVGIQIGNVRYFGSQPWPFPNSLMIGFTAEYAGGELRLDPEEIEDAGWFTVDRLPLVPPRLSIARWLIERFVEECGGDPRMLRSAG